MRILFVCTGNICRSPTAEAVLRARLAGAGLDHTVDSAGIQGFHAGEPPHPPAIRAAAARGYDLRPLRARKLERADFRRFDLLLAMDRGHLDRMRRLAVAGPGRIGLFLDLAPGLEGRDVPDPYYGGNADFEQVLDLVEAGCDALVAALREGRLG
ncbi:MAG: low molecular weight protein-tyrosine-phosphatase [Inquilinus sp.]|uniref:low molecular weight protein-tyrosine-phosphatase n=1 Tax=Inquilinus sp. TaxID=1932117 RepID=UPI003F34DF45